MCLKAIQRTSKLAISREGFVFFSPVQTGLAAFNPATNQFRTIGTEDTGGGLPSTDIRALAFDAQNRLWIGTLRGLRVLFNPGTENPDFQTKLIKAGIEVEEACTLVLLSLKNY